MSSLPEEFDNDDDETPISFKDKAPEAPIHFAPRERTIPVNSGPKKAVSGMAAPIALLSLVISVMVLVIAVDHPIQKIGSLFSGKKTAEVSENSELKAQFDMLSSAVAEASHKAEQAANGLRTITQDIDNIRSHITEVDARQTNLENRVIQIDSKLEAINARPVPKPVVVKPKEPIKMPVLVNVVSIRNQGGVIWASLREGLDTSPLLTVGDEWRSFKVVGIDPATRGVQIATNGTVTTVRL